MGLIRFITRAFIDVFGITHPTPKQERQAEIFITVLLSIIVVGLLSVVLGLYLFSRS